MVEKVENKLNQEIERMKGERSGFGFSVSDCPLWLYKKFVANIKSEYHDIYWVKLMDIMRKADAYDKLMMIQEDMNYVQEDRIPVDEDKGEKEEYIETFGGRIPVKKG